MRTTRLLGGGRYRLTVDDRGWIDIQRLDLADITCQTCLGRAQADMYRPAAARGAEFLTRVLEGPQWRPRIDLDSLNLCSSYQCVLGQLYGVYERGVDALGLNGAQQFDYGFTVSPRFDGYVGAWEALTEAWRRELTSV